MKERFVIDDKGRKTAVILPMKEYLQLLEDLHDLQTVAERRKDARISVEELKSRLDANARV